MKKIIRNFVIRSTIFSILFSSIFTSCQFFENDVGDFMEKYTETAAIEEHSFTIETYEDASSRLSFSSFEDAGIEMLMRNPKKFTMLPSANFAHLDSGISRDAVEIVQKDTETVYLNLPQSFLIAADEGKDITADINLYEPMSGRTFDTYTISMHCNSVPPLILNPTVVNNGGSTFAIAFDMPNEEEVAIRHKDLAEVVIDGVSYPVSITTEPDAEGILHAVYDFPDSHFTRSWSSSYIIINQKDFSHNRNSVYYETGIPFTAQDKEFSIVLKDKAGLKSEVLASTSISKLVKPVIKNQNGTVISEGNVTGIPFDEETKKGTITIIPPDRDHLGNAVSGATVHYRVYEATGSGIIYMSGTTTEAKTIELPQNSYRVEAYATLTNYENSATTTVRFRFVNNVLYINPGFSDGDGSEVAPWSTFADAFADINSRPGRESKFTLYFEGNSNENVVIDGSINTDELEIRKKPGASVSQVRHIKIGGATPIPANFVLSIHDLTVSATGNGNSDELGTGIIVDHDMDVLLDNIDIINCSHFGLHVKQGNVTYNGGHITGNSADPFVSQYHGNVAVYLQNSSVTSFTNTAINGNHVFGIVLEQTAGCNLTGGSVSQNGASAIYFASTAPVVNINGTSISQNPKAAEWESYSSGTLNLEGTTTISQNTSGGIELGASGNLNIKGAVSVTNNSRVPATGGPAEKANVILPATKKINITGALTSGCSIGIRTADSDEPTVIGNKYSFTSGYSSYNTNSPSAYFTSDRDFGVVPDSGEAGIALGGATGELPYSSFDYTINFTAKEMDGTTNAGGMYYGVEKSILLIPEVTRSGTAVTPTTSGGVLKIDDVAANLSVELYNSGSRAATIPTSNITDGGSGRLKVTLPANVVSYKGNYTLKVRTNYLGLNHDANFAFKIDNGADNAAQYISSLTTAGTYNVVVEGPVGAAATAGLAKVANAIRSLTSGADRGVRINLDARATINSDFIEDYNDGCYFYSCRALVSIALPDWMQYLVSELFLDCDGLESIEIPDTVQLIMEEAFNYCSSLTEITLPATISGSGDDHGIEEDAFGHCTSLATINFTGTTTQWKQTRRATGWHSGVPATVVHCVDGDCGLDAILPLTGGVTVPGGAWSPVSGSEVFISGRNFTFDNLWVSDHETTQAEYVAVMGTNPSEFNGSSGKEPDTGEIQENRPVENVSWYDALVYCNKRSIAEGLTPCYTMKKASDTTVDSTNPADWGSVPDSSDTRWNAVICNFNANGYRLPTEAEWEYCARGGNLTGEQFNYSGTNNISDLENYAWYSGTTGVNSKTHEVRKKSPNVKGLYDMSGNVAEWCWDIKGNISATTPATGVSNGSVNRVSRGGTWSEGALTFQTRGYFPMSDRHNTTGFRVVRTIP